VPVGGADGYNQSTGSLWGISRLHICQFYVHVAPDSALDMGNIAV